MHQVHMIVYHTCYRIPESMNKRADFLLIICLQNGSMIDNQVSFRDKGLTGAIHWKTQMPKQGLPGTENTTNFIHTLCINIQYISNKIYIYNIFYMYILQKYKYLCCIYMIKIPVLCASINLDRNLPVPVLGFSSIIKFVNSVKSIFQ